MPSKLLELEQLHLTSVSDKLRLSITSSADFRIPAGLSQLNPEDTVKALASGNVWISRAASCGLDVCVYFDGKRLEENRRVHMLESLGYRLRDAHIWSQLLLSPSLEIPQPDELSSKPDLSILLGHGKPPRDSATDPRAWLSSNIDVKAPESVLSAALQRSHVSLKFHTIPEYRQPRPKRTKTKVKLDDAADTKLLDVSSAAVDDKHFTDLEEVVGNLSQGLSNSIASCFEYFQNTDLDQRPFPRLSQISNEPGPASIPPSNTWSDGRSLGHTPTSLGLAGKLPSQVQGSEGTPGDDPQLHTQSDEDMLLPSDLNLVFPTAFEPTDDEMLFSQTTESTPSLVSQPTTMSTASAASSVFSLKRSLPSDSSISLQADALSGLNISPACKLAEVALRLLIGGYDPRRSRGLLGVRVDKPPPQTSLSDLAPGVFSPTFKESMSHNARFLPAISQAVSSSWPRNVQSPILRRKLIQLANPPPSALEQREEDVVDEEVTTDRLASVVQARLWAMMQRKLYDPLAARASFNPRSSDKVSAEPKDVGEDDDLLDELGNSSANLGKESMMQDLEDFMKEEFGDLDEFEDLLGGGGNEEDDLLGYFEAEERERLEDEHETDEMLFGSSCDDDWGVDDEDMDMLLLELWSEDESMLL